MQLAAGHVILSPHCKHLPENHSDSDEHQLLWLRGSRVFFTKIHGSVVSEKRCLHLCKVQTSERLTQTPLIQMICKEQLGLCGAGLTNKKGNQVH